ncbi:MAG: sulfotransferase domain-containing protein [Chitinophagales bacterium]
MKKKGFNIDFIGIGAAKAGTTWVAKMLYAHPQICLSEPKEVHFFNAKRPFIRNQNNDNYQKGLKWYEKHFTHCLSNQIKGEFSTSYLADKEAAQRMKTHFPNVKIIVCLRNPIDRFYSNYNFRKHRLQYEKRNLDLVVNQKDAYVKQGLYYQQLQTYLEHFSMEDIYLIFFEDIKNCPEKILKELYTFLGVDRDFLPEDVYEKKNASKMARLPNVENWIRGLSFLVVSLHLNWLIVLLKKWGFNDWVMKKITKSYTYPPMSQDMREKLKPVFEEDINNLENLLKKDLSHWKK